MSNSLIESCFHYIQQALKALLQKASFLVTIFANASCLPHPPSPAKKCQVCHILNGLATISLQQALLEVESISNFRNECWNKFCVRCLSILHQAMFYRKQLFSHQYNTIARQVTQSIALWNRAFTEDTVHYAYYQDTCEIENLTLLFRSVHVSSWSWPVLLAETFC